MTKPNTTPKDTPRSHRANPWLENLPVKLLLMGGFILSVAPFLIMLNLSLKSQPQYEYERWAVSAPFHWENYSLSWSMIRGYIWNSIVVSGGSALGVIVLSLLGGYAFAKGNFPFKEPLFILILSGMMIPGILYLVPKFILYKDLNLINTRWALLISYWTEGQIFGIFLCRSYFEALPRGLDEAAEMDGAGIWARFRYIALPLSKPIICTLGVMNILFTWNDIIWPWIAISDDSQRTISIGMSIFQRALLDNQGPMFAGFALVSLPLIMLFLFTTRSFIAGLTSGAFKA